jgi:hypothetical protein
MSDQVPTFERVSAEMQAGKAFRKKHPAVFWTIIVAASLLVALEAYSRFVLIPENARLQQQNVELNNEIINLKQDLAPFRTAAILKYGGEERQALNKLAKDVEKLDRLVADQQKKIHAFSGSVTLTFSNTIAKQGVYIGAEGDRPYLRLRRSGVSQPDQVPANEEITFITKRVKFFNQVDGRFTVAYESEVVAGQAPLGGSTDTITNLDHVVMAIPMVNSKTFPKNLLPDQKLFLDQVDLEIFVNGEGWFSTNLLAMKFVELPQTNAFQILNWTMKTPITRNLINNGQVQDMP